MPKWTLTGSTPRLGSLTWSWIGSKKVRDRPPVERQQWITPGDTLALSRQCRLLGVTRSVVYERQKRQQEAMCAADQRLLILLDEEYTRHPFLGTRRMTKYLCGLGHRVNRKRVQRLMRTLRLVGMAPGPNTSKGHPARKVYS